MQSSLWSMLNSIYIYVWRFILKISTRNINNNAIIDIYAPKLDLFITKMLRKTLISLIKDNTVNIIINFSNIESLCPDALGVILAAHKVCLSNKGKISLFGVQPDMLLIFHLIKMDKYLHIYNTEDDAISHKNIIGNFKLKLVK